MDGRINRWIDRRVVFGVSLVGIACGAYRGLNRDKNRV